MAPPSSCIPPALGIAVIGFLYGFVLRRLPLLPRFAFSEGSVSGLGALLYLRLPDAMGTLFFTSAFAFGITLTRCPGKQTAAVSRIEKQIQGRF